MVWLWNADGIPGPVSPATTGRSMRRCCRGDADGVLHHVMPRMTGHLGGMVTVHHAARPPGQDPHDHQGRSTYQRTSRRRKPRSRRGGVAQSSLIPSLIHPGTRGSIGMYSRSLSRHPDLCGYSCTVILNPEKRKVGGSTPPLTTTLTRVNVGPVIVGVQLATLVVSFLGHLPQADARTSTHSRRSQPHLLVQSAWDQRWLR